VIDFRFSALIFLIAVKWQKMRVCVLRAVTVSRRQLIAMIDLEKAAEKR